MKIIRIAKPGEIMNQPHGHKPSGKLDSQIFLEKKDPQHTSKKKRKKKAPAKCNTCEAKNKRKKLEEGK